MPCAASGESSRNGAPLSAGGRRARAAAACRGAVCRARAFSPPPSRTRSSCSRRSAASASWSAVLALNRRSSCRLHLRHASRRARPCRPRTRCSSVTVPSTGAVSASSIFIDSSTTTRLPGLDRVADRDRHQQHGAGHRRAQLAVGVRVVDVLGRRLGHVPRPALVARARPRAVASASATEPARRRRALVRRPGRRRAARRRRPRASSRTARARRRGASRRGASNGSSLGRRSAERERRGRAGDLLVAQRRRRRGPGGRSGRCPSPPRARPRGASSVRRKPTLVVRPRIAVSRQRAVQPRERGRAVRAVGDHLGDHRVVVGADDAAGLDRGVDAHAARVARQQRPGRPTGRSCASSALMRASIAWPLSVSLDVERLARGDPQLQLDQVEPGDQLGHRVLDLQPRVHLEEEVRRGVVGVGDELDRAGAVVARGLRPARPPPRPAARAARARRPATATPRAPSGGGAAASTRARRARARCRARRRCTCTSMCRARGRKRSMNTRSSPKPAAPRAAPRRSPRRARRRDSTTRIPRPPPPAAALTSSG